jgi:hypothetical protein
MKKLLLLLSLLLCAVSIQAQEVKSYEINAEFFPENASLYGYSVSPKAFMRTNSVIEFEESIDSSVTFYLHSELRIDSILCNDKKLKYETDKVLYYYNYNRLALKVTIPATELTASKSLDVHYAGYFNPSKVRSISDYMRINDKEGVFLRGYGYSLWFPVFIDEGEDAYEADFKKVYVKLPTNFKCLIGGDLISENVKDSIYTAVWKPGVTDIWQIQCTGQHYDIITKDDVLVYHVDHEKESRQILEFALKLKRFFAEKYQNVNESYPLYIMEMPKYGNISSKNVIGIAGNLFTKFEEYFDSKSTIAHELVHPYVHIDVKRDNSFFALVKEGFPSYFHLYALSKTLNKEEFDLKKYMEDLEESYLNKRETGKTRRGRPLPVEKPILKIIPDEIGSYKDKFILSDRVRLFLYDLLKQMGDDDYQKFLKELFAMDSINYEKFEMLTTKYIPGYEKRLHEWLRTTKYSRDLMMAD